MIADQGALPEAAGEATIFALASGTGRAAIAVLRLSGRGCGAILQALCGPLPPPRQASLRALHHQGALLDRALVLWFPGPRSFTGEDCAELHLHGGRAVVAAVTQALVALQARPAEPGEFSRRAFLNGKMDLLEAEAVADLVDAETDAQRRAALRQMDGELSAVYHVWAIELRRMLAWQEATIDFPDEDLPPDLDTALLADIAALHRQIESHLADAGRGERLREGLVFVLSGAPNVGKSSLLNALAGSDVAIVSARPGTTRDAIEVRLDLAGIPVTLVDTAGLRDSADEIEAEGVRRSRAHAARADLVIAVIEAGGEPPDAGFVVANKIDLAPAAPSAIGVSARTGAGLADLHERLAAEARRLAEPSGAPMLTRARHRAALTEAALHLATAALADFADQRAEDLRLALRAIGRITGEIGVEDLLDTIFSSFCIGK